MGLFSKIGDAIKKVVDTVKPVANTALKVASPVYALSTTNKESRSGINVVDKALNTRSTVINTGTTTVGDLFQAAAKNTVIGRVAGYDPNITTRAGKYADTFANVVNTASTALAAASIGVPLANTSLPTSNLDYANGSVVSPDVEGLDNEDDLEASMPISPKVLIGFGFFLVVLLFLLSLKK